MKTLLHIGTEKTGSTSLQKWAAKNREALAEHGIWYGDVLGRANHTKLYLWALPEGSQDHGFAQIRANAPKARAAFRRDLPGQLAEDYQKAKDAGCHTFLISNEHCHSRLLTHDDVERVKNLLEPFSEQIDILCYLRPQVDLAVSLASTRARVRKRVDRAWFNQIAGDAKYFDFDALYHRWADVFGEHAIRLVSFKRNADTTAHLCAFFGLDPAGFATLDRQNEALDIQTIAIQNILSDQGIGPEHPRFKLSQAPVDHLTCTDKLQIGEDMAQQFQDRFSASNDALAAVNSDITQEDLTPDWSRYAAASNLDLLEGPCAFGEKLVEMLMAMNISTRIAILNQRISQMERAIWTKNRANAVKLYRDVNSALDELPVDLPAFAQERAAVAERLHKFADHPQLRRAIAARAFAKAKG